MPRVPYQFPEPGTSAVADAIRSRRNDGELIQLDGVLYVLVKFRHLQF